MKIDVVISHSHIIEEELKGKTVIVIDTLRATSVMVTAIGNKAFEVIPVTEIDEAKRIKDKLVSEGKKVLLGGERKGLKIEGFDLSNSPLEYAEDKVSGRTVIMTTSNGTRAISRCASAGKVIIASMCNAAAAANYAVKEGRDIVIVNAGTKERFSADDFITAGYITKIITKIDEKAALTDIAWMSRELYEKHTDIFSAMDCCFHYNYLKSIGYDDDLNYCLTKDRFNVVPVYCSGSIKVVSE